MNLMINSLFKNFIYAMNNFYSLFFYSFSKNLYIKNRKNKIMEKKEEIKKEIKELKHFLYALLILAFFMILFILPIMFFYYNTFLNICYFERDSIYNSLAYMSWKYSTMKSYLNLKFGFNIPEQILDFMKEYEFRKEIILYKLESLSSFNNQLREDAIYLLIFTICIIIGLIYFLYKIRKIEERI
jgi:hypothetical protein